MHKMLLCCIALLCALGMGCGNKAPIPTGKSAGKTSQPQQRDGSQPVNPGSASNSEAAAEAAGPAPAIPTDIPSETDDSQESVDQTTAGLTPSFKLGSTPAAAPTSPRFKEGTHYSKIVPAQPTSTDPDHVEALEVFWYGSGTCFALDTAIESWRAKTKPAYVEFVRVPAMWNEPLRLHARMFYTAEMLGKLDELHGLIFREVNIKGNPLDSVEKISAFFREHGVGTDQFQTAFSSVAVESKLQRADFLNRRLRIQAVPALVINGKYRTSIEMAGSEQQMFTLIAELAAHEHDG
jgi:protein dithiol oxidoreductase (disulfide-forming)